MSPLEIVLGTVYLAGVFVTMGICLSQDLEEAPGVLCSLAWPLLVAGAIVMAPIFGLVWVGDKIGSWFK